MAESLPIGDAVLARLQSHAAAAVTVYDAVVPHDPDDKYAVHYPGVGMPRNDRHSGVATRRRQSGTVTCVGKTRQQAGWVADRIVAALTGFWPDPSGSASPLVLDPNFDPGIHRDDSDPADIRFTHVLRYTITTSRS